LNIFIDKASQKDSKIIWKWKNDPISLKMSFIGNFVTWEEHQTWYKNCLEKNDIEIYIAKTLKVPIGVVRFEKCIENKNISNISINLAPEFRNKGFSIKILIKAIKTYWNENNSENIINAEIKKENIKSIKLFENCGFILVEDKVSKLIYSLKRS